MNSNGLAYEKEIREQKRRLDDVREQWRELLLDFATYNVEYTILHSEQSFTLEEVAYRIAKLDATLGNTKYGLKYTEHLRKTGRYKYDPVDGLL